MIRLRSEGLEEKITEGKLYFRHHFKVTHYQQDSSLLMSAIMAWLRECLSGFSTAKLLFSSPFPYCAFWKEVT